MRCRAVWLPIALVVGVVGAGCSDPPALPADPSVTWEMPAAPVPTPQTSGAVDVVSHGARGDGTGDDTRAFVRAQVAALAADLRYRSGPTGDPQAVVYVPPGTYRLLRLPFRSNVRMEVDAGAVLVQADRGRPAPAAGSGSVVALIEWDGPPDEALTNVALVGVNSSSGGRKTLAEPVYPDWTLDPSFTFDLDPATTGADVKVAGVQALNVDGFLIQNVYSIQNDSNPTSDGDTAPWPQTQKAALGLRGRPETPIDGSVYYDPHNGVVENWYNIHGPKGYGPNQVNAGHNLTFRNIFSQGGTALRLETDASDGKDFGSELRGVTADVIVGFDCNRAVSFSPHGQVNHDVYVARVRAVGCGEGVVESDDGDGATNGAFLNSSIAEVTVTAGTRAQLGDGSRPGSWVVGPSRKAFAKDRGTTPGWSVVYQSGSYSCSGQFQTISDRIKTTADFKRPTCA